MAEIALAERLTSPVVLLALTAVSSLIAYIYYRQAGQGEREGGGRERGREREREREE